VKTQVVALSVNDTATLSYGFAELGSDYSKSRLVRLHNFSNQPITFNVGHRLDSGSPHSLTLSSGSVTVPARSGTVLAVTLNVPARTAGNSSAFHDVAGEITFTPRNGANSGVSLAVPYYLVPQATSKIRTALNTTQLQKVHSTTAVVGNIGGVITGTADWYAWGISDADNGLGSNDVRAAGVQSFPGDGVLAFGLNTYHRWSNAAADEFDVMVDLDNDGKADYDVVEADHGAVTTGTADGLPAVFVFDLRTGDGTLDFLADAPTDSTTMVLPALFDQLCNTGSPCLSASNPRFSYTVVGFAPDGSSDVTGSGQFNAFSPSISTGMFDTVAPNHTATETVALNPAEFAQTPNLGAMVISHDNANSAEAQLIGFK
jgi:minor extracellular serine protease Vpr